MIPLKKWQILYFELVEKLKFAVFLDSLTLARKIIGVFQRNQQSDMKTKFAIGIDLGGTNLRVGLVRSDGKIEVQKSVPVGKDKSAKRVAALIGEQVVSMAKQASTEPIGCGCGIPGIVNAQKGIVYSSPNFPAWKNIDFLKLLKEKISLPLIIDNDANMFALAELLYGAGRGHKNLVVLTLGSGIGGGIVIDGKVFHGDRGFAGEVGHIVVEPEGVPCGCGSHGCFEQYAASRAFINMAKKKPIDSKQLKPELMAKLARQGDKTAKEMWKIFGSYLGIGIASLINALGITTIVMGGGITKSWDLFIGATRAEISRRTYKKNVEHLKLLKASLSESTGIVGAASAVFQH